MSEAKSMDVIFFNIFAIRRKDNLSFYFILIA
jgi:hypothetical protein